ncbi:MAG: hypothetical protein Q6373_006220 [Candidatus Sigynarchaeota archaeon]
MSGALWHGTARHGTARHGIPWFHDLARTAATNDTATIEPVTSRPRHANCDPRGCLPDDAWVVRMSILGAGRVVRQSIGIVRVRGNKPG